MATLIQHQGKFLTILVFAATVAWMQNVGEAFQRGGRGGGGGGARPSMGGGGMGGARPSMPSRPSMPQARPAPQARPMPQSRPAAMPQMPASRPSLGNASRPNMSMPSRPSGGLQSPNLGTTRPTPQTRPTPGIQQRPDFGTNRPSLGLGGTNKLPPSSLPNAGGGIPTNRPAPGNLGNTKPANRPNLQLPSMPSTNRPRPLPGDSGLATKPAPGFNRPSVGGGGERPSLGGTNRPTTLPGGLPGNGGNRPSLGGQRPQTLPGNITGGGNVNRPNLGNRPTTKPAPPVIGGNRPTRPGGGGQGTFPGVNNRPGFINGGGQGGNWGNGNWGGNGNWNRPDWNRPDGNRPNWGNGNNNWGIGNGNWGNNNNFNNININNNNWSNNMYNRPAWDRPGWNNWGNQWGNGNWQNSWHNNCIHPHYYGWYNGCWNGYWGSSWYSPVVWGAVGWGLGSWTSSAWNSTAFVNPYYTAPAVANVASVPYDYSQPVVVNNYITADAEGGDSSATSSAAPVVSAEVQQSFSDFDVGLEAFKNGKYTDALASFNTALQKNGSDPVLHEVRALALFATEDYKGAAAALNSLLASAPGMDWTTMSGLYGDSEKYTEQLRKLESYCKANPRDPASAFVLAYHYLVIGSKDSAIRALKVVVENQPSDTVAKRMLSALEPPPAPKTEPPVPSAEEIEKPQPEINLIGKWKAINGPSTIELTITDESSFVWGVNESGKKVAELSGDLATNGDAVVFETKEQGSLGGTVKAMSSEEWVMLPPGVTKEDAGIRFKRVP
jgi:tetratricopeptide (TPR) repeat protein